MKTTGSDTAMRLLVTARLVPLGRYRPTCQIVAGLQARGYHVTDRTVQRDLAKLSDVFGIERDSSSKPHRWRRTRSLEEVA